jgi:hypothetical protein
LAIAARRLADDLPEKAIEVSERLKAYFVCDFADATIEIEQKGLCFSIRTRAT